MSKKGTLPLSIAPLQRVVAQPITDPAERAALERSRKRHKRKRAEKDASSRCDSVANSNIPAKKRP